MCNRFKSQNLSTIVLLCLLCTNLLWQAEAKANHSLHHKLKNHHHQNDAEAAQTQTQMADVEYVSRLPNKVVSDLDEINADWKEEVSNSLEKNDLDTIDLSRMSTTTIMQPVVGGAVKTSRPTDDEVDRLWGEKTYKSHDPTMRPMTSVSFVPQGSFDQDPAPVHSGRDPEAPQLLLSDNEIYMSHTGAVIRGREVPTAISSPGLPSTSGDIVESNPMAVRAERMDNKLTNLLNTSSDRDIVEDQEQTDRLLEHLRNLSLELKSKEASFLQTSTPTTDDGAVSFLQQKATLKSQATSTLRQKMTSQALAEAQMRQKEFLDQAEFLRIHRPQPEVEN